MHEHDKIVCLHCETGKAGEAELGIKGNTGVLKKLCLYSELLFMGASRSQRPTSEETLPSLLWKDLPV